ncbi:tyrosine-type recombinase/integrase [uncultured Methanolobus sp.]|uniref:tyrosine-type recombinase/integrase n=1 Tax=uncultured Methanolobus sp. TaxID=218300 RepID=UPI002AAAD052|nr:tyrosine-type recombinase/integrase [uncultured Methanolobus sp.]
MSSIYEYEKNLVSIERRIENASYCQENKDLIYKFCNVLFAEGIKLVRVLKYMAQLNILARDYDLDLKNATKDDIYRVVGELERKDLSQWTKYEYKITIKRFFRWMNGGEDPEITKWIKPRAGEKKKLPEELLTEDEIKRMIRAAEHLRDKALVAVLYDSGARISEIGNLRLKHVVFDQYGAVLTVDGKTGMRRVRVIFSAPYLASWIDMHPQKEDPDAFLWINVGQRNHGAHMKYQAFRVLIKRIAERAGIEKRVYNHLFRHSRSTELSQHLTEAQMEEHLGWIHGSKMPRTYIHMSGRQMDDAILKIHGILKKEDLKPELTSVTCPRCEHVNGPTSDFCCKCGMTLTV